MKNSKKFGKKGKFVDLPQSSYKNKTTSNSSLTSTNGNLNYQESNMYDPIKTHQEYETPLQTLQRIFPNFSPDVIESIYEENDRTFFKAKKCLEEMCTGEEETNSNNPESNTENKVKVEDDYLDINAYANFKYEDENPFIEDQKAESTGITNLQDIKKKFQIDLNTVNNILSQQKKNSEDYVSVFSNLANENTPTSKGTETNTNNYNPSTFNTENYLEELTLDYYCEVILEFFPKLSRLEVMEKICEYDFDIDRLILTLLDEKNSEILSEDLSKLELDEISVDFKDEVLTNFYSGELAKNHTVPKTNSFSLIEETIFNHNLQTKIEKEIKKQNINAKLNTLYSEKDFPALPTEVKSNLNSNFSDEYFLDKEIKDIKTKSIKDDLVKLTKNFPFTDEFEIKWVYYQFMDYNETFKYFKNSGKRKGNLLAELENARNNITSNNISVGSNGSTSNSNTSNSNSNSNSNNNNNQNDLPSMLFKIISEKPSSWKIESTCKNFNINDYQTIRKKLLWQAQMAWRSGRHKDGAVIMAKARRYKEEINFLLKNKKIEIFMKNNSIQNFINNKENFIDLHGLNYEESKMLINKKIFDIIRKKQNGEYDPNRKFILNIITGIGNHSKENKSVLLMKLPTWLKNANHFTKVDRERGTIRVFL